MMSRVLVNIKCAGCGREAAPDVPLAGQDGSDFRKSFMAADPCDQAMYQISLRDVEI